MEEKILSDEEIVKALECLVTDGVYYGGCVHLSDVLDIVHRLQGENERLKKDYIELDLEARELRTELDKELAEHKEFTKKAKEEIDHYKCVTKLLEQDIADRDKKLESKVEEVYADFMHDYKIMRDELDECYAENTELQKKMYKQEKDINALLDTHVYKKGFEDGKQQSVKDTAKEILEIADKQLYIYDEFVIKENRYDYGYKNAVHEIKGRIAKRYGV